MVAPRSRFASRPRHGHPNHVGHDGWLVRNVIRVGENQLQTVRAEGQRDQCLRLSEAEMKVLEIIRDALIERVQ